MADEPTRPSKPSPPRPVSRSNPPPAVSSVPKPKNEAPAASKEPSNPLNLSPPPKVRPPPPPPQRSRAPVDPATAPTEVLQPAIPSVQPLPASLRPAPPSVRPEPRISAAPEGATESPLPRPSRPQPPRRSAPSRPPSSNDAGPSSPVSAPSPPRRPAELVTEAPTIQRLGDRLASTLDSTTLLQVASVVGQATLPAEPRVRAARELVDALAQELAQNPKPIRAGRLHFEMGRLFETPLGEPKEAVEHFQKAHALLGDHLPAIRGARRGLLALGRMQDVLALFEAEIKLTAEPDKKAQLFYEKGCLLEDVLGQRKEAREAFESALGLGPGDATRIKGTLRIQSIARSWDELSRSLEREANVVQGDARHRSAVIAARARLLEAHRRDAATAAELYQRAMEGDPQTLSALHALKRLHYGHQRWRDLIGVLAREAELASDPSVRALCQYRIGRIYLDRLGSVDEGVKALELAVAENGADSMILEELARAYDLGRRHKELAGILEKLAESASSAAERIGHYQRIAELYEMRLGDEERAVVWYERARTLDRGHVPVLQALSKLYAQRGEYEALIDVHAGEAETVSDLSRRAAAYARIAEIYELKLGRPEDAMQHHARALGALPGYAPSFKALVRLLSQAGRHTDLVELYERAVDRATDTEARVTYLYKIGRLYEDALGSPEQAVTAYRRLLEVAPDELAALHSLQRSAERAKLFKELIEALELEAERTTDRRRKLELYHRAGEVAEADLGDDALAIAIFKRLVELDKAYAPGYASLGRLFYKAGRTEELLETYKNELRLLPKGPGLAALLFKMGQLYEEQLARDEEAIHSYRRAVEADPGHRAALRALERKLNAKGLYDELVKLLETELAGLEDRELRARTAFRIGEVYENRLRAPEKALAAYELALGADPELGPARDGRIRLLSEARDYKRLVEELEREAQTQRDPRLAVAAWLRAGEVYRDDLGDPTRAVHAFEAVIERDPSHLEALIALEALYAERTAWEPLANVYSTQARVLTDPGARVGALRELARLQASGKVENLDRGRQAFGAILQLAPTDLGALSALERIALAEGDVGLLAHVDAKLAAVLSDPVSVAAHETRLGELLEAARDPQALDVYRAALARDPEAIGAARGVSRIAELSSDPALLEEAAEREARIQVDPARAASVLVNAAKRLRGAGQDDRAVNALLRALEIHPEHEPAALELEELLNARGEYDRLIAALVQAAGATKKPARAAALWIQVAGLHADRRADLPAALAVLRRAEKLVPGHVPTLMNLAEIHARDGQWTDAVERLRQVLAERPDKDLSVEANLRLATILDERLNDAPRALGHLDAALSHEPNHRAALERLVQIQARRGQFDLAAESAARLVRVSPETSGRVAALTLLGRLERERGQTDAAIHAYEQVVAVVGTDGPAADELRELLSHARAGEFSRYVAALARYAETAKTPAPAVFLELADVLSGRLQQREQALVWLERGLNLHPDDAALRAELASTLLAAGQHQRALAELQRVLATDVRREDVWRQMIQALEGQQRGHEALLAKGGLVALGVANDAERVALQQRVPRTAQAAAGAFGEAEFTVIDARKGDEAADRLLAALGDIAGKVNPPELERWGVTSRDRVSAKSPNAVRALADRIASIFGVGDYELYVHRAHTGLVEVELTDPVSVLVPAHVASLTEPEQAFLLARVLANVARGLSAVDRLAPSALEALLAAAARLVEPAYAAPSVDEEYLAAHARRVGRALPWLGRGPIEDAARIYAAAPHIDFGEYVAGVRLTAVRAAAVLADDLPSSVALVRRLEGDLSGAEGAAVGQASAMVDDLLRFWVSDPAGVLRRRLGLS
jgi:tetratricopeptide (TPR) repeat protein